MTHPLLKPLPVRSGVASQDTVEALHDMVEVLSIIMLEFTDAIDKAAVRDAMQHLLDVALVHDALGGYGVYPALDAEEVAETPATEVRT
jgi:hypothetical protein